MQRKLAIAWKGPSITKVLLCGFPHDEALILPHWASDNLLLIASKSARSSAKNVVVSCCSEPYTIKGRCWGQQRLTAWLAWELMHQNVLSSGILNNKQISSQGSRYVLPKPPASNQAILRILLTKNNLEGFFFAHNTSLEKCFWDNSATLIAYIRPWGVPCIFLGLLQDHLEGGSVLTPCTTHPACPVAAQLHSPASVQVVSFGFNTWNTFLMLPWGKTENNGR